MKRLKRINIFAFSKFQAFLMALLGFVCGIIYSFGGLIVDALVSLGWITTPETPGLSYGSLLAFGALVGMPLLFALAGFLAGILEALLYNLFARWFGGLNINFEHKE